MLLIYDVVRRWLSLLAAVVVLSIVHPMAFAASTSSNWDPPESLIAEIEEHLSMPPHASPLKSYVRYYSGITKKNRHMIVGTFLLDADHAGIKITEIDRVPRVLDGGCGVITLKYDVRKKRVLALFCNGVA